MQPFVEVALQFSDCFVQHLPPYKGLLGLSEYFGESIHLLPHLEGRELHRLDAKSQPSSDFAERTEDVLHYFLLLGCYFSQPLELCEVLLALGQDFSGLEKCVKLRLGLLYILACEEAVEVPA